GSARLADRDVYRREIDVRAVVDVQSTERNQPGQGQPDEQDDGDDRIADRPCGDVAQVHWLAAWVAPVMRTGFTRSPSLTKPPARAITRSLPSKPATIVMPSSVTMPVVTFRRSTRLS